MRNTKHKIRSNTKYKVQNTGHIKETHLYGLHALFFGQQMRG
jgi:hypothetical protein